MTSTSTLTRLGRATALLLLAVSLVGTAPAFAQTQTSTTTEAAIRSVIEHSNAAQVQAVAARDATLIADTSVGTYAQQLVRTNQNLLDSGVTVIELVNVDWGPVAVDGNTATATTIETWRTSYSDGPTEYGRDRNVYSLALGNDGGWKVVGNQHPDTRSGRLAFPAPEPPPSGDIQPGPGTSRNWSGYAARGGDFTSVSATWTVPTLALDGPFGADAAWVGIGGLRTRDLIQAGTQQTVTGNGSVTYQAWIEMLPEASRPVPLTVLPGHTVTVSVDQQQGDTWLFSFVNQTSGQTLERTVTYSSSLSSAEGIQEAPYARRRILPITQFGTLPFSKASAVRDGQSMTIGDLGARAITLVDNAGKHLAVPSPLGLDGASFSVGRI
jgi:ketosteroid isomerase-like protein